MAGSQRSRPRTECIPLCVINNTFLLFISGASFPVVFLIVPYFPDIVNRETEKGCVPTTLNDFAWEIAAKDPTSLSALSIYDSSFLLNQEKGARTMENITINTEKKGPLTTLYAKAGDVGTRFFRITLMEGDFCPALPILQAQRACWRHIFTDICTLTDFILSEASSTSPLGRMPAVRMIRQ